MRTEAELRHVHRTAAVDLQEREQRGVEARALEIGELVRRRHEGVGVGGAAEGEVEQRHAADGALFDDPGDLAVQALLEQDARHIGRDAEAEIDGAAGLKLLRDAPRDDLLDVELRHAETVERTDQFARDRRIIERLRRLLLVGIDDDVVYQHAGHPDIVGPERAILGDALHLGNDDAAIVAGGERLVEPAEIGALVLVGQVAAFVRCRGADDGDLRRDRREVEPVLAFEGDLLDDRLGGGLGVHRAALADGSTKVSRPILVSTPGRLAAASRCMSNMMPDGTL